MRIAVVGAGAIGGWLAARLAASGHTLGVIAREPTLEALRNEGVSLSDGGRTVAARVAASDRAADLGVQDLVFLTVKGWAIAAVAGQVAALLGPETLVVPAINGVPWWFFHGLEGPMAGASLESVDPGGLIAASIPADRVIGCVVHAAVSADGPGRIVHRAGRGLILGEPAGGASARAERIASVLAEAGFEASVSARIQQDVWYKLWGNMTLNPVSALTGAATDQILDDPLIRGFLLQVMAEAAEVGRRIGCPIEESGEARIEVARRLGAFKTSMLQDVEAGRPLELDGMLEAPREIAQRVGAPTPGIDALLGLARQFARVRRLSDTKPDYGLLRFTASG
jgi:2-dehydropantoate 2-reductase